MGIAAVHDRASLSPAAASLQIQERFSAPVPAEQRALARFLRGGHSFREGRADLLTKASCRERPGRGPGAACALHTGGWTARRLSWRGVRSVLCALAKLLPRPAWMRTMRFIHMCKANRVIMCD